LRDAEDQLAIFTERQSAVKRKISGLEHTIELLVEDYRNATEMYMNAKDDTVTAAFDGNNVANDCIAKVQEEKADLEREFRKISKEWFQAMDKLDFSTKQHKQIVDKMNEKLTDANTKIKDLKKRIVENDENNNAATKEMEDVVAQRDLALSTIEELAERCKLLVLDLENSSARLIDVVAMKDNAEYTVEVLSNELRESDDRKMELQSKLNELKIEKADLLLRNFEAEANVKLLSDQVVYAEEEISRLSLERDELGEEYELQLQKVQDRVNELNLEIAKKDNEYQELWSKSNYMLLEKETTAKVFKELQVDIDKTAEIVDQRNILFSEVKSLEHENEQQQHQIEELTNREHHLKQRIRLLENSLSPSHVSTITELQDKNEALQKHNDTISKQLDSLGASHSNEIETMKAKFQLEVDFKCFEQRDLTSKIDAMEKQLKEKDATIARLGNQLRGCKDENSRLQTDLHLSVLQNDTVKSLMDTLSRQEATIEEQLEELEQKEIELEEKDSIISNLASEERYCGYEFNANSSLEFPVTPRPHKLQQEMIKLCSRHA
jgi:chromosome segregation ATPase